MCEVTVILNTTGSTLQAWNDDGCCHVGTVCWMESVIEL